MNSQQKSFNTRQNTTITITDAFDSVVKYSTAVVHIRTFTRIYSHIYICVNEDINNWMTPKVKLIKLWLSGVTSGGVVGYIKFEVNVEAPLSFLH